MSSSPSLALLAPLLVTQLDVALKDVVDRIEAIRASAHVTGCETAAAQIAGCKTAPTEQPVKQTPGYNSGPRGDPNRIVTLAEASHLSSLSVDTLRRKHRDKWVRLSQRRYGIRYRHAVMLSG
jgi:hypothetical protein